MEKQFKYKVVLSFDVGRAIPKVEEWTNKISDIMNKLGFEGKYMIRSSVTPFILTSNIEFNGDLKRAIGEQFEKMMNERFQMWDWRVEEIRLIG